MFILKLEQNLFEECNPDKIAQVEERREGDSIYRSLAVDFFDSVEEMTVEKRKYPYFFKYYLYLGTDFSSPADFKNKETERFLLAFYSKYCPEYVKASVYDAESGRVLEDYFEKEKIPGEAMQHFIPGKGPEDREEKKADGLELGEGQEEKPAISVLEGYHVFSQEEKQDIGSQLDALKNQFADQLKELNALIQPPREKEANIETGDSRNSEDKIIN